MSAALEERHARLKARLKDRAERVARGAVVGGEVLLGAALSGLLQGMHEPKPGESGGPKILGLPVDLGIGITGVVVGAFELAGNRYSSDVGHLGLGFLAGFANDFGHSLGARKRETGHWLLGHAEPKKLAAPVATKAAGQFDPKAMAESLVNARLQQQHA